MKIEFRVDLTTEAEPILQEERTLVKENNKMPKKRRWGAYDDGSGFKLQVEYRGSPWGGLGTVIQTVFSFGVFFYGGCVLADQSPPPPLEWLPFPPLVAAVLITPKGAESPGSGRKCKE